MIAGHLIGQVLMHRPALYATFLIVCLGVAWRQLDVWGTPMQWRFVVDDTQAPNPSERPKFIRVLDYHVDEVAHSASIVMPAAGEAHAFELIWFQGQSEGGEDVAIWSTKVGHSPSGWHASTPSPMLYPKDVGLQLQPQQAVKTLGNTVQFGRQSNRYLTTVVSVGGWAMASLALVEMDANQQVVAARKLSLSPILNRSYLVRSPTIAWQDGDIGVPAYFEMGTYFGVLVRMSAGGEIKDQRLMSRGQLGIQPQVVVLDELNAVAFLRNYSDDKHQQDRLVASWTSDGGQTWSKASLLNVPNPSSPVAALKLSGGDILMGFNDHAQCADVFRLAVSSDGGRTWRRIATLEEHGCDKGKTARYPMLKRLDNGDMALTYSFNNKGGIRAYVFNERWVRQQMQAADNGATQTIASADNSTNGSLKVPYE